MPRSFDMVADYLGTVAQVHRAFCTKDYWLDRLAEARADVSSLDSFADDGQGGTDITTIQTMFAAGLPAIAAQFHRGDLTLVREEHWGPLTDGQAVAAVRSRVPGVPGSITGSGVLTSTADGARLKFSATVEVRIPLLGGKLEEMLGQQMRYLIELEQKFTSAWIAARS
ncbi:DUF2505 domain-containing protein [Mycobacterium sp. CBMA293]|uniref:DUF2505 domain-containing protein n=1 Tax=unclassified Mycolicibacterium TaxID=2636767 RepID=UPI0012DC0E6E|nr:MULTISPECIES: DUF2505 domain-containing protein [unclassified Mycolicibacterium]MUL44590.1 DUF2505 domain-containing protein [Mycolicibacterium sp. CBMA 360]MUL59914.1 DUF2505 domain-containing protein [Mycolicibacterium sp. CBMA 335]MUL68757.1 DUF2505 domain-containing protein [Mycolicibacterium sp. CBMA 311]MUL93852.1 DUF2505 domain-containing protein [Mycolicibacterium sp. CBMA 230]MUM06096.1 hypothetical protein [Mycolicibacterium sp. CBMA 213]